MVGGTVIGLARRPESTLVHVQDKRDTCSILVVERRRKDDAPVQIQIGDAIWWHGRDALWTPTENRTPACNHEHHYSCSRCGVDYDIRLPRIGYSH